MPGDDRARSFGAARYGHDHRHLSAGHYGGRDAAGDRRLDVSDDQFGLGFPVSAGHRPAGEHGRQRRRASFGADGRHHSDSAGSDDDPRSAGGAVHQRSMAAVVFSQKRKTMNTNPFIEAREKLPSAITTLPPNYLNGNAAPLLAIVEELRNSYRVELRIIQTIKNLDVTQPEAVGQLALDFESYNQYRDFDRERTHCHNIDRIARTLLTPLRAGSQADRDLVAQLEKLLVPLREADNDILDDIEELMRRASAALITINSQVQASQSDPARLNDARSAQQAFVQECDPRLDRLKAALKQMNTLANDLLDRL